MLRVNLSSVIVMMGIFFYQPIVANRLPLLHNSEHGDYALPVHIADSKKPFSLLVDTGSSNVNIVGDDTLCPDCSMYVSDQTISAKHLKSGNKHFSMHYGLGGGTLKVYRSSMQLSPLLKLDDFEFGVYTAGNKVINILGLALPGGAAPKKSPMKTLFNQLNNTFKFNDEFTLLLCGDKPPSYLYLGPLNPALTKHLSAVRLPVVSKQLYEVPLVGIGDGQTTRSFPATYGAIIDSGTSGSLVFPKREQAYFVKKIKATLDNPKIEATFWSGNYCMARQAIDIKNLPDFYFYFKDANNKVVKLTLSAKQYITSASCPKGYVKLAFISHDFYNPPAHKKRMPLKVVLGTPFLEQYMATFTLKPPVNVTLYDASSQICQRASED